MPAAARGPQLFLLLLLRRKPVAESGDAQALKSIADTQAQIIVMLNKVGSRITLLRFGSCPSS
jgi:hypothetical protein